MLFCCLIFFFLTHVQASILDKKTPSKEDKFRYPFYLGLGAGYGTTTWGHLVPDEDLINRMRYSTPTHVSEGGTTWGAFAGYEFMPTFALEAAYLNYPAAKLYFDEDSFFTENNDNRTELTTHTETVSVMAKFQVLLPNSTARVFSSAGAAGIHRYDAVKNIWRATPTFGGGVNYNITERIMAEVAFNYTAGYGQSELDPSEDFVPFVYSVFFRLGYRF